MMFPKGTRLYCRQCGTFLFIAAKDLEFGMAITASLFEYTEESLHQYENGDRAVCMKCGNDLLTGGMGTFNQILKETFERNGGK